MCLISVLVFILVFDCFVFICFFGLVCGVALCLACGVGCLLRLVKCLGDLITVCLLFVYCGGFIRLFVGEVSCADVVRFICVDLLGVYCILVLLVVLRFWIVAVLNDFWYFACCWFVLGVIVLGGYVYLLVCCLLVVLFVLVSLMFGCCMVLLIMWH